MRTTKRVCAGALQVLLLAACGSPEDQAERPAPPPVEDTAFGEMAGTLEKARGLDETTRAHKQALDEAIERSEASSER